MTSNAYRAIQSVDEELRVLYGGGNCMEGPWCDLDAVEHDSLTRVARFNNKRLLEPCRRQPAGRARARLL